MHNGVTRTCSHAISPSSPRNAGTNNHRVALLKHAGAAGTPNNIFLWLWVPGSRFACPGRQRESCRSVRSNSIFKQLRSPSSSPGLPPSLKLRRALNSSPRRRCVGWANAYSAVPTIAPVLARRWVRFRLRSSSYAGQVALPTPRICFSFQTAKKARLLGARASWFSPRCEASSGDGVLRLLTMRV